MGARQLSARDGCVGGRGPHGRRCQLAPAPRACWGSLCCGETARCCLAPCQPPAPLPRQSVYPAISPRTRDLEGMFVELRAWQPNWGWGVACRDPYGVEDSGASGPGCGGTPGLPPAWDPAPRSSAWGALTVAWPGTRAGTTAGTGPQPLPVLSLSSCRVALSVWFGLWGARVANKEPPFFWGPPAFF